MHQHSEQPQRRAVSASGVDGRSRFTVFVDGRDLRVVSHSAGFLRSLMERRGRKVLGAGMPTLSEGRASISVATLSGALTLVASVSEVAWIAQRAGVVEGAHVPDMSASA